MNVSGRLLNLPNSITIGRFVLSAVLMVFLMFEQSTPVAAVAWLAFVAAEAICLPLCLVFHRRNLAETRELVKS